VLRTQNGLLERGTDVEPNGIEEKPDVLPIEKGLDIACNAVYCRTGRLVTRGKKDGSLLGGNSRRTGEEDPENLGFTEEQRPDHHNRAKWRRSNGRFFHGLSQHRLSGVVLGGGRFQVVFPVDFAVTDVQGAWPRRFREGKILREQISNDPVHRHAASDVALGIDGDEFHAGVTQDPLGTGELNLFAMAGMVGDCMPSIQTPENA
jgi:hypothetical protein